MNKEVKFTHNGESIMARLIDTPTGKKAIRFENENGEYRQTPVSAEDFGKLMLPRDLKKLQKLYDEAREIPEESRMLDGTKTDVFDDYHR